MHMIASCYVGSRDYAFGYMDEYLYPYYVKEKENGDRYYLCGNLAPDCTQTLTINGKTIQDKLSIYQTAIYVEKNGQLKKVGKTK